LILLAGSQGQAESGLTRIANDQDRDLRINRGDTVIFSADPIPGNELNINELIDTLSKKDARIVYSALTDEFHVSGHGNQGDLKLLMALTNPKFVLPIGGNYKHMVAYRRVAEEMGYLSDKVIFADDSKEIIFSQNGFRIGKSVASPNVYVDQISGDAIDNYVIMDRQKIAKEGVLIIACEINPMTGQLSSKPDVIARGILFEDKDNFSNQLGTALSKVFSKRQEKVQNWSFYRKTIQQVAEKILFEARREPLVSPVVLEI
jgi:ribonuclease J